MVCGDNEYIIHTALSFRNKSYGAAQEFVWAADSSSYALRESTTKVSIYKNFKEKGKLKLDQSAEGIYGGALLGVRSSGTLAFYDWETEKLVRRIEIDCKVRRQSSLGLYRICCRIESVARTANCLGRGCVSPTPLFQSLGFPWAHGRMCFGLKPATCWPWCPPTTPFSCSSTMPKLLPPLLRLASPWKKTALKMLLRLVLKDRKTAPWWCASPFSFTSRCMQLVEEIDDSVKTAVWVGDCFIYTTLGELGNVFSAVPCVLFSF